MQNYRQICFCTRKLFVCFKVKEGGAIPSLPHFFMAQWLTNQAHGQLYRYHFYLTITKPTCMFS